MIINVWFDIVCPFCYIGKRQLARAIAQLERPDVEVLYRAFQLSPEAPLQTDQDLNSTLQQRYGMSRQEALDANTRVGQQALGCGLRFDFERARWANTRNAHRLIKLAARYRLQAEMVESLCSAFFVEGLRIGELSCLQDLGARVGLPGDEVAALLSNDCFDDELAKDRAEGIRAGLHGVPFFVVGDERGGSEMITATNLARLLRRASAA